MPHLDEPLNLGDILKDEAPKLFSRDAVIVAQGQNLALGTVVSRLTASDEVVAYDPSGSDGSQEIAGIIIESVDATEAAKPSVIIARQAAFAEDKLILPDALTAAEKKSALKTLKALQILTREGA